LAGTKLPIFVALFEAADASNEATEFQLPFFKLERHESTRFALSLRSTTASDEAI
jgi:hypothetical protein